MGKKYLRVLTRKNPHAVFSLVSSKVPSVRVQRGTREERK